MSEDASWLYHDHLDLEGLIDDCGAAARREDWTAVERLFARLVDRLKGHMRIEEEVLFPAYEEEAGAPAEPTEALRNDHDAMVHQCRDLHYLLQSRDGAGVVSALPGLKALLKRHDEKEEQFFLPMAGHTLGHRREEVLRRLEELSASSASFTRRKWGF